VVEQQHLVHAGFLGLRPRLGDDAGAALTVTRSLAALAAPVTSVFHVAASLALYGDGYPIPSGGQAKPRLSTHCQRGYRRIECKKGPGSLPGPFIRCADPFGGGSGRARVLNDVDPGLDATLDRLEGFLGRGDHQLAESG